MHDNTVFPKISRLSRDMVITEKIDGTNGRILIGEDGSIRAGSKGQWLTLEQDNFGFCKWVMENKECLLLLGPGIHFGEWWGPGINKRKYPVENKRFSLFNVSRWKAGVPPCCDIVPILYQGSFSTVVVDEILNALIEHGSVACPGFKNPEGVVIFHKAGGHLYKKTIEKDSEPKGL